MYNAKDCEQCNSDSVCCYCKNITYYQLEEQLKAKEQECEILKDEYKILEYNLDSRTRDFEDVIDNYKQTLAEIKDIAEKLKIFYEELGKCEGLTVVQLKQILQKISEVENEITTR